MKLDVPVLLKPPQRSDPLLVLDSRLDHLRLLWVSRSSRREAVLYFSYLKTDFFFFTSSVVCVILYPLLMILKVRLVCWLLRVALSLFPSSS